MQNVQKLLIKPLLNIEIILENSIKILNKINVNSQNDLIQSENFFNQ